MAVVKAILVLLLGWHGFAPHYSMGLMAKVARHRGMQVSGCMVSSPIEPLGTRLWVLGVNTNELRLCTVVDVSHPRDKARHIKLRRVVEIAGEDELTFCGHRGEPVWKCPVVVWNGETEN